jgi:hypothetical protein
VISLVRYSLATVVQSQRYLPPVLLFIAILAIFTSKDNGPLVPVYALSSAAVFICATWLTVATVNTEDPTQRSITVVNAGGSGRVLVASVWVAFTWCALIIAIGLFYPLTSGHHPFGLSILLVGALAELTGGCTGVAVGLLCSRLVIRRAGYAAVIALFASFLFLLVPNLPPVNPVFHLLAANRSAASLLLPVLGFGAVSVLLVVASTALTRFVALRRD